MSSGVYLLLFAVVYLLVFRSWKQSFANYQVFGDTLHRVDPWFQYRATKYLSDHGWHAFFHWFDRKSWYPIGRPVGGTIYPGLQLTAVAIHRALQWIGYPLSLQHVCFLVPFITSLSTKLFSFLLAFEMLESKVGAVATLAILCSIPAHILYSMGGEYSFECVATLGMTGTFYFWVRSLRTPSSWPVGIMAGLAYGYMVAAWGGYVFVLNLVALHAGLMALVDWSRNSYNSSLLKAYGLFFVIGTGIATRVPPVAWSPFYSAEQLVALFVLFMLLGLFAADKNRKKALVQRDMNRVQLQGLLIILICVISYALVLTLSHRGLYFEFFRPSIRAMVPKLFSLPSTYFDRFYFESRSSVSDDYIISMFGAIFFANFFTVFFLLIWLFIQPTAPRLLLFLLLSISLGCITRSTDCASFAPFVALGIGALIDGTIKMTNHEFSFQFGGYSHKGEESSAKLEKEESAERKQTLFTGKDSASAGIQSKARVNLDKKTVVDHLKIPYLQIDVTKRLNKIREENIALTISLSVFPLFLLLVVIYLTGFFVAGESLAAMFSNPGIMHLQHSETGSELNTEYVDSLNWIRDNTPLDSRVFSTFRPSTHISSIANRTSFGDDSMRDASYHAITAKILLSSLEEGHSWLRHLADYVFVMCSNPPVGDRTLIRYFALVAHDFYTDMCPSDAFCTDYADERKNEGELYSRNRLKDTLLYKLSKNKSEHSAQLSQELFDEVYKSPNNMIRIYKVQQIDENSKAWVTATTKKRCQTSTSTCKGEFPPSRDLDSLLFQQQTF